MARELKTPEGDLDRHWFIRAVARRGHFTIGDVEILFRVIEELMIEIVKQKKSLILHGLFAMSFTRVAPFRQWDGVNKKWYEVQEFYKIRMKASKTLTDVLREERQTTLKED